MVVAVQGFLFIEPGAGNGTGGVVYGDMQRRDKAAEPFIRRGVHLKEFAKVSGSGAPGMGVFQRDEISFEEGSLLF